MESLNEIVEFRTNWNNEFFFKHRRNFLLARRIIRKSVAIVQTRFSRHLKLMENDLKLQLQLAEEDRQVLSNSFTENLQQRLELLQNRINTYSEQMKTLVRQEKDYWKKLESIIAKRTGAGRVKSTENLIEQKRFH